MDPLAGFFQINLRHGIKTNTGRAEATVKRGASIPRPNGCRMLLHIVQLIYPDFISILILKILSLFPLYLTRIPLRRAFSFPRSYLYCI